MEDYDLVHVVSSDIIIVNMSGLNSSDGTKIKIHDVNRNCCKVDKYRSL